MAVGSSDARAQCQRMNRSTRTWWFDCP